MPTAAERQALAFLAGVALLGGGARVWLQHREGASAPHASGVRVSTETVDGQLTAIDSVRTSKKKRVSKKQSSDVRAALKRSDARTKVDNEIVSAIDVDVASAEELEQLPRVGPALAQRIVANRDSLGPFGSIEALGEVRGIGPAMVKLLTPLVTFSARPRATARNAITTAQRSRRAK